MRTLNRVNLIGRLGADPDLQLSRTGRPYARLSVATHRSWINAENDQERQVTDWHSVFVWGPLAEQCAQNLRKGSLIWVEGTLTYWQVANESKTYKNAVHGTDVRFLSPSRGQSEDSGLDKDQSQENHNAVAHIS